MRFLPLSALLALHLLASALAQADTETSSRISWIQSRLDGASSTANYWQYGWTAFYGVTTVAYASQADSLDAPDEQHDRVDAKVGAVSSLLGLGGMFLDPLTTGSNAKALAALPQDSEAAQTQKLQQAERMLRQNAEQEQNARSTQAHVLAAVVSVLSGVAVARDDHRNDDGAMVALQSLLVGELQIYTAPTDATKAWEDYQRNGWQQAGRSGNGDGGWLVGVGPQVVEVSYRF